MLADNGIATSSVGLYDNCLHLAFFTKFRIRFVGPSLGVKLLPLISFLTFITFLLIIFTFVYIVIIISTIIIIITILSQNWPGRCTFSLFSAQSLDLPTPNPTTAFESAPNTGSSPHDAQLHNSCLRLCRCCGENKKRKKKSQSALQP